METSHAATVINLASPVGGQVSDLVGYYTLNSVVSGTISDTSGLSPAYNATLSSGGGGSIPTSSTGVNVAGTSGYGNGLTFSNPTFSTTTKQGNAVTAATTLSTPLDLASTDLTLGTWIKMDSIETGVAQTGWLLDKKNGSGGGNGWAFSLSKDISDRWTMTLSGSGSSSVSATFTTLNDLQWHEIAVSFEDATDNTIFYVDGVAIADHTNTLTTIIATTAPLMIGQRNTSTAGLGTNLNMEMDDIFITNGLHTFNPVPEPSTVALIGMAGGLVIFLRRRA